MIDYRLVVLTHGDGKTLERTLESFWANVTPWPSDFVCVRDGPGKLAPLGLTGQTWRGTVLVPQQGFCAATREAWREAAVDGPEYVFWLEHDFLFTRPVDLEPISAVLDANARLAQVSLLRGPENAAERRHGGVIEELRSRGHDFTHVQDSSGNWIEHRAYFTTNPSLMRREFIEQNEWPGAQENCEGKFGLKLIARGYSFGIWGDGERWVEHIGVRDGFGY